MLLTYFTGILLSVFHFSTGDFSGVCLPSDVQHVVFPQYGPGSGSIFANDPAVVIFTNTFAQAVFKSKLLSEVLDISQTSTLEYSKFLYEYVLDFYTRKGFPDAAGLAEFDANSVLKFKKITLPLMVKKLHNTAGNSLYVEGVLKMENAERLALQYADTIEKDASINLTSDVKSKYKIIADSFYRFIEAVDGNSKTIHRLTNYYWATEWFVATVNYKWVNHIGNMII